MNNPEIVEGAMTPRGHPKCIHVIQGYQLAAFIKRCRLLQPVFAVSTTILIPND